MHFLNCLKLIKAYLFHSVVFFFFNQTLWPANFFLPSLASPQKQLLFPLFILCIFPVCIVRKERKYIELSKRLLLHWWITEFSGGLKRLLFLHSAIWSRWKNRTCYGNAIIKWINISRFQSGTLFSFFLICRWCTGLVNKGYNVREMEVGNED